MTLVIAKSPATVDDLRKVPKDGRVYELVDGAIIVSPAGFRHSEVAARITVALGRFVFPRGIGAVVTEGVGIELPTGNVRSPDACFVGNDKLPGGRSPEDFGALVPDLVVEVLSPHDNMREVKAKLAEYLDCGVPLVWIADPKRKVVTVHRSMTDAVEYADDQILTAEPVLPGFACRVSELFPR